MIKLKLKTITVTEIMAAFSLLLSIFVFYRGCTQEDKIDRLSYNANAAQFRPIVQVVGEPAITSMKVDSNAQAPELLFVRRSDTLKFKASLLLTLNLRLTNVNPAIAHMSTIFWTDTLSGDEKIREMLRDRRRRSSVLTRDTTNRYFAIQDISFHDTVSVTLTRDIVFLDDQTFTLHFLFLYRNETGALFDTYYWARYHFGAVGFKEVIDTSAHKRSAIWLFDNDAFKRALRLIGSHSSTEVYTKDDSEDILDFISKLLVRSGGG